MVLDNHLDYRKAGVDLDAAENVIVDIKKMAQSTFRPEVLEDIGGFGGLFALNQEKYSNPVLVSGADGVGTKLKLAFQSGVHNTVGQDCVAMCVNDILVQGAEPLFFLDYLAVGKMDSTPIKDIIAGIALGCQQSKCALLGGETAEMPDFYQPGEYELAGFSVGIVEKEKIIDGSSIKTGNSIIGLASSGVHSNGFSLVRKILEDNKLSLDDQPNELSVSLGEELLKPTKIYVPDVLPLLSRFKVNGMAHITGGGLPGNVSRILPFGVTAVINKNSWEVPPVFSYLKTQGGISEEEMFNVFNMGIGYVLIVPSNEVDNIRDFLTKFNVKNWVIGNIITSSDDDENKVIMQ